MAMIHCETMDSPEGMFPLPTSQLPPSSYPSHPSNVFLDMCLTEGNPASDSGVDVSEGLQEPEKENRLNQQNDTSQAGVNTPLPDGKFVGENFFMNPIVNGMNDLGIQAANESIQALQQSLGKGSHGCPDEPNPGGNGRRYLYASVGEESISSTRTESTILREDSLQIETPTSEDVFLNENADSPQESMSSDSDHRLFQPEDDNIEDNDEDESGIELPSGNLDMRNAKIVIDKSDVHFGSKISLAIPSDVAKVTPNLNISASPEPQSKDSTAKNNQGLHININTPTVQTMPPHFPVNKTQSTPVPSSSPMRARELRDNPRLGENHVSLPAGQLPQANRTAMLATPTSPAQGNFHISNAGNIVLGPQIIFNSPQCRDIPVATNTGLEKVLKEAEERLALTYKHQTKRSLLPWLKGHQIMTDFYTESRILAVDRQGKQTRQTVDLVNTLVQDDENRFILEGEPGMGKTLLACKLAIDWANKKSLQKFKFVFLIFLRDFKDSLEDHVQEELLSSLSKEKFKQVWDYCKNNEEQVLFILDGYDELEKSDESKIQKLIESRDFLRSKVVVTSRPDVLRTVAQRIVVKGFSEAQMFEFIGKYFKLVSDDSSGHDMKRIIEKDYKYRKLAKRPLFCVLLCMLYDSDVVSKLPERLSDLMFKIMLCLIKWNNKKVSNVDENTEAFPPKYEKLFLSFGKLSLKALKTDKTRFSEKEILEIGDVDTNLLLQLGFLSNDSENDVLGTKKFWKPVHKIFLEYLAGLYIANHISHECNSRDCKECREFSSVYHHENVLQFVVGTLDKKAYLALNGGKYQMIRKMKDTDLLMLLREAGPTKDNCHAVAKLLDHSYATVYTSEVDFEGWGSILAQKFSKLKTLEIVWRIKSSNPDQESSFTEASPELYKMFFTALKSNNSINKIKIRATQDGEPFSEEKIGLFFSNLEMVLPKENLKELEIKELKMHVSSHLKRAIDGATYQNKKALNDLEQLRLDMFMDDEDLFVLCDRLRKCAPKLKELQLTGLVIGFRGFSKLVELLKMSKSLQKLHISMDKARLQSMNDCTPSNMYTDQKRMNRLAVNESKRAFNERERKFSLEAESTSQDASHFGKKPYQRPRGNSVTPIVTLEKIDRFDSSEYYSEAEINSIDFENEVNTSRERRVSGSAFQQLLPPREDCTFLGSARSISPVGGRRSPSLSSEYRGCSPSPRHDEASSERTYYNGVKDPTKELSYLFQDPLNTGTRLTHVVNRYSFVPGDGKDNLPLPLCNDREHKSVFHDLFSALPESTVKSLTLDYPCLYLSTLDLVCLGDAIRKTKYLETLKLQNLKNAKKYIPVVLGLGQCQSLTSVTLESKGVIITDASFSLACLALRNNTTLKRLSLAQWEFSIEDRKMATRYFKDLLSNWKVNDLNLANCTIDIGAGMSPLPTLLPSSLLVSFDGPTHNWSSLKNGPTHNWSSIKTLRLPHVKLKQPLNVERRGHLLLPVLRHCPNLTVLDLSAPTNHVEPLDDCATRKFFQLLGTNFKKLKELTLCNWEFRFKNYEETCSDIGQLIRSCAELRTLVLDKVSEVRSGLSVRTQCCATLLHQLVHNLPRLSELSLCFYRIDGFELDKRSAAQLGACFHNHWNSTHKFKLKFFGLSPAAETALYDALMRDNFKVNISKEYPLEITVRKPYLFAA